MNFKISTLYSMQFQELSFIGLMFSHQSLSVSKKSLENMALEILKCDCKKTLNWNNLITFTF